MTEMIFLLIILHSAVHIYDFHIFIIFQCIKFVVKMASMKNSCIVFVIERLTEKNLNQCKDFDKRTLLLPNSTFLIRMIRLTLTLSKSKL